MRHGVRCRKMLGRRPRLSWASEADFESGLGVFVIQRDGRQLARLPEKPVGRFGRSLFQASSYHDTPEKPLPEMRCVDPTAASGSKLDGILLQAASCPRISTD